MSSHLQFTGACIFHSWKWLICRFIQSGAGTALDGSIIAACLGESGLAERTAMQGASQGHTRFCPQDKLRGRSSFPNPCSSAPILSLCWVRRDFHRPSWLVSPMYLIQGGLGWLLVVFQLPVAGGATQLHLHLVLEKRRQAEWRADFLYGRTEVASSGDPSSLCQVDSGDLVTIP